MKWNDKPCLEWTGYVTTAGYGRTNKKVYAHRDAWEKAHGPIPEGMWVLHHCDNRRCYEVTHLFLGTHLDNMRDAARKGRLQAHGGLFGSSNPSAKLSPEQVLEIRQSYTGRHGEQRRLAERFGVSPDAIGRIVHNKGWLQLSGQGHQRRDPRLPDELAARLRWGDDR
jgi:hypothetical protein